MVAIGTSKVTARGRITIPAEVRRRLGLGSGAVIEWAYEGGSVVVRRAGKYASEEVHAALLLKEPGAAKTLADLKEGVRRTMRRRYARR